jgi:folylpolyglutamate synthase/dihydropteroate synthase
VFTAVADPHAHLPDALLRTWRRIAPQLRSTEAGTTAPTPDQALQLAASLGPPAGPVVVAGSLYLVGAIRATLTGEQPDP